ncbi:unnamed protein product [Ixodes persulcatus]
MKGVGTLLVVRTSCPAGHMNHWESQPYIKGRGAPAPHISRTLHGCLPDQNAAPVPVDEHPCLLKEDLLQLPVSNVGPSLSLFTGVERRAREADGRAPRPAPRPRW